MSAVFTFKVDLERLIEAVVNRKTIEVTNC